MKLLNIKNSWFSESDLRLDASYHLSDGPVTKLKLKKSPYKVSKLSSETEDIFKGNIFKRCYVSNIEFGYPFMTASDMMKSDIRSGKFISKKYTKTSNLFLKRGWILVSRSGTLGNTVYTNSNFEDVIGTDDLIRIIPNNKNVLSGFMYAYLASKFGYGLLTQSGYGGVIQHIEPHHLENLPIPVLPIDKQKRINSLIIDASNLRVEANELLDNAKKIFREYEDLKGDKVFKISKSKLTDSWLVRNNRPEIYEYEKKVLKKGYRQLSFFAESVFAPPMFKHIYLEKNNGYPFFNGAEISKSRRFTNRYLSIRGVNNIDDYIVKKDSLLIYRHGPRNGMLGDVFLVDDFLNNSCLSDLVIRVVPLKKEYSYWLFTFFSTKIGREILHNIASGSAILFLSTNRVEKIKIPYPQDGNSIEENFNLISEYCKKIFLANKMENEAINLIEKEIESWQ